MCWIADPRARRHLDAILRELNRGAAPRAGGRLDAWLGFPSRRLAVYGTLAPGEVNAHELAGIHGAWCDGVVHGDKKTIGWGADLGFPVLVWRPAGPVVAVKLFVADGLRQHLPRLDAFEGDEYRRTLVPVDLSDTTTVVANIYTAADVASR